MNAMLPTYIQRHSITSTPELQQLPLLNRIQLLQNSPKPFKHCPIIAAWSHTLDVYFACFLPLAQSQWARLATHQQAQLKLRNMVALKEVSAAVRARQVGEHKRYQASKWWLEAHWQSMYGQCVAGDNTSVPYYDVLSKQAAATV